MMVGPQKWLDIVSTLTWHAASYVRPDTKKGGNMDPTDYVKVKCIASGDTRDRFVFSIVFFSTKIYMAVLTIMWN